MQSQRSTPKKSRKENTFFRITKPVFFHFSSFHPSLLHQCITFSFFFVQIEQFKLLWNCHLKLYKSSSNSKGNKLIFKNFLRGLKIGYELFSWIFFVKTTPPTLGDCNFLASSSFLPIFSARDVPRGGLHLVLEHHKQWGRPAKTASKTYLKWSLMGCSTLASELLLWSDYCEWQVSTMTNKKSNLTDVLHPDWSLGWAPLSDNSLILQGRWSNLLFIGDEPFPSVKRTGLWEIKISLTSISHSLFPVASSRPSVTGYSLGTLTPAINNDINLGIKNPMTTRPDP